MAINYASLGARMCLLAGLLAAQFFDSELGDISSHNESMVPTSRFLYLKGELIPTIVDKLSLLIAVC
jgi:hypothetical protein